MARTQARIGYRTKLQRSNGASPPEYYTVAEVRNVGGPSLSRDAPEATNMDSDDGWKEFVKGLKDGGEVSFEVNLLPGSENDDTPANLRLGHNATDGLLSDFSNDDTVDDWRLVFPGTGSPPVSWDFAAILTGFETDEPVDDVMTGSCTLKVTGKPELQ